MKKCMGMCFGKRITALFLVAAVMITIVCSVSQPVQAAKTKVKLKKPKIASLAMKKGEKYKLKVTVSPAANKKTIRYTSSKKKVAAVSSTGVIRAVKKGKASIRILDKGGKILKSIKVTVYSKLKKVKKITLNHKTATLEKGGSLNLKAKYSPKKATVKKVTYVSSDKKIAAVTAKGRVTAKKAGKVTIHAYAKDGRGASASCRITVRDSIGGVNSDMVTSAATSGANEVVKPSEGAKETVTGIGNVPQGQTTAPAATQHGIPTAPLHTGELEQTHPVSAGPSHDISGTPGNSANIGENTNKPQESPVVSFPAAPTATSDTGDSGHTQDPAVPGTAKPGTTEDPTVTGKTTGEPTITGSVPTRPGAAGTGAAEPTGAGSGAAEPTGAGSGAAEPTGTGSGAAEPTAAGSGTAGPTGTGTSSAGPVSTEKAFENVEQTSEDISIFSEGSVPSIYIDADAKDAKGLGLVAESFEEDIKLISGRKGNVIHELAGTTETTIIAGVVGDSDVIDKFVADGVLDVSDIEGKWETYKIFSVRDTEHEGKNAIVIAGSDKRGAIYGIYHISEQMGVSPWAYWGDVVPEVKTSVTLPNEELNITSREPDVKYRGIFLNDEAPSLTGWVKNTYGNYNEKFYAKVFELILRLKGNYLWPAMWNNAFSVEGTDEAGIASAELADQYGIVMGTSHHEPMCRAGNEWGNTYKNYVDPAEIVEGEGSKYYWDYDKFPDELEQFWSDGITRNKAYENIYTIGMRGEADSALEMSVDTFKNIINCQKNILKENNLMAEPNVLVLYKEIEKMWYEGDGSGSGGNIADWDGLDDTTIMLCEDNFGNMRTLPTAENRNRKAGWGMYYHFDYVGAPRSYQWVDTVPLQKTWEQMSMAYDYGVDDIWIVNVGDLKPMEMSISYFLDMAYDFDKWGTQNKSSADEYTKEWLGRQFGGELDAEKIADVSSIMTEYLNINGSRKPEIVLSDTYSVTNYNEALRMLQRCRSLIEKTQGYLDAMSEEQKAAFFQLVYYPAVASANVNCMQIYAALNEYFYEKDSAAANLYGKMINDAVAFDKELTDTYNNNMYHVGDKWKNMMSSPHVGFTHWNSEGWTYPEVKWVKVKKEPSMLLTLENDAAVYQSGDCTLADFTSTNRESYAITLTNGGGKPYSYTASGDADWIRLSKTEGTVAAQDMLAVSVDWSKVTETKTGTITVTGAGETVKIHVTAKVTDISGLEKNTYVEEHGFISINADRFTGKNAGANGESFEILRNYGKNGTAVKVYPTTVSFDDFEAAPFLEYKIHVATDGEYTIQSYLAPSNNVHWNAITLRYGISIDGGEITTVDSLDGENFQAGNHEGSKNTWSKDVMDNVRTASSQHTLTAGTHTLRLYARDPALVLEKILVYSGTLKTSYFGPEESYYVGKTGEKETCIPDFDDGYSCLPGTIQASFYKGSEDTMADSVTGGTGTVYRYPVILTADGTYRFKLDASAGSEAEVELQLDGESLGTVSVASADSFTVAEKECTAGEAELSLVVKSGTVQVSSIRAALVDTTIGSPIYVSASSGKAEQAFDKEEDSVWTPTQEDQQDGESYLTIDFMGEYYVDHFTLLGQAPGITSYEIQLYDGKKFETVYSDSAIQDGKPVYIQGKKAYHGSKMRVLFHGGTPAISECKVTPYINWASEDTIKITGHDKNGDACDIPDTIADGDRITKALESGTMGSGSEVIMEFSKPRTVDAVNVISLQEAEANKAGTGTIPNENMTSDRAQTTYTAYYYSGGEWMPGGSVTESDETKRKVLNRIAFPKKVTTEKVKVVVNTSYWVRIVEMEPVFTYENSAADLVAEQTLEAGKAELSWTEGKSLGRIRFIGSAKAADVMVSYKDEQTGEQKELSDFDIWEEEEGFSLLPAEAVETTELTITAASADSQSRISVWNRLPEDTAGTDPSCSCRLSSAPEFITEDADLVIPKEKSGITAGLEATCNMAIDSCTVEGHKNGKLTTHYSVLATDCSEAYIHRGKLVVDLGEAESGTVILKTDIMVNGKSRSVARKFNVTKSKDFSEGYQNFALATNGGTVKASQGENNGTNLANLIDGDKTASSTKRWRTDKLPAYIEIRFNKLVDVSEVDIYGQDISHPIKACTVSYLKDGEWVEFENGSISGNTELHSELRWNDSVKTPAVRIDIPKEAVSANDGWARFDEVEVWGTPSSAGTDCECQLGVPQYTGETEVVSEAGKGCELTLTSETVYSITGCGKDGHADAVPEYSYKIVEDADHIASISDSRLTIQDSDVARSAIIVETTATLNGIEKKSRQTISVTSGSYENYALPGNGATITANQASSDAPNLVDGDRSFSNGRRWRTSQFPATLDITLDGEHVIKELDLFTQQDSGTEEPTKDMVNKSSMAVSRLNLYYKDTSSNDWKLFADGTITGNNKVWIAHKLAETVTTSEIRVEFPEKVADGWARLVEIEVWGEKVAVDPETLSKVDLSKYATDKTGTGSYNEQSGELTFTYGASSERLYFPLSPALAQQIYKEAGNSASTKKVKICIDWSIDKNNIEFDTCLMSPSASSSWNGTAVQAWTWATTTEGTIEKTAGFGNVKENNFGYVMIRLKSSGEMPTVVIKNISVSLVD